MGFHSFLQKNRIPLESVMAKSWNKKIFKQIDEQVNKASKDLAEERGACPDAAEYGYQERFSNKTAIAPTASILLKKLQTNLKMQNIPQKEKEVLDWV